MRFLISYIIIPISIFLTVNPVFNYLNIRINFWTVFLYTYIVLNINGCILDKLVFTDEKEN